MLLTVLLLTVGLISIRFIRSPKAMLVIAVAIALAWFGPRIVRFFKRSKK